MKHFPNANSHHVWIPDSIIGVTKAQLAEKVNFRFTGRHRENDTEVFMPLGWCMIAAGEHLFHLLDDQERRRAIITMDHGFQSKEGQYAVIWVRRYGAYVEKDWDGDRLARLRWGVVSSDLDSVHEGEWLDVKSVDGVDEHLDALEAAILWLFENRPEWEDPFAYWEESWNI